MLACQRVRAYRFDVQGDAFAVLVVPGARQKLPGSLTAAEREVAEAALRGRSNAQIAAARGTSVRTVANQFACVLRKTGAGSRRELSARFTTDR